MSTYSPNVSALITDFWQRYPARHDARAFIGRCVVSIYANSEPLVVQLRRSYRDQLTIARPEILVAVIQDPDITPSLIVPDATSSFGLTVPDGRVEWTAEKGLLRLFNRGRYMIGGDCLSAPDEVRAFVNAAVADWAALGEGRLQSSR